MRAAGTIRNSHENCNTSSAVFIHLLYLLAGVLLLLAGRRLFWLAVGLAAFVFSLQLTSGLLGEGSLAWIASGVIGLAAAWLAVKFLRSLAYLLGFLAGAILLPAASASIGLDVGWYVLALAGGVLGFVLVALTLQWGLVLITAFAGAEALSQGVQSSLALKEPTANVLFLLLLALGIAWQGARVRQQH
jgi:hypothetical protein